MILVKVGKLCKNCGVKKVAALQDPGIAEAIIDCLRSHSQNLSRQVQSSWLPRVEMLNISTASLDSLFQWLVIHTVNQCRFTSL